MRKEENIKLKTVQTLFQLYIELVVGDNDKLSEIICEALIQLDDEITENCDDFPKKDIEDIFCQFRILNKFIRLSPSDKETFIDYISEHQ